MASKQHTEEIINTGRFQANTAVMGDLGTPVFILQRFDSPDRIQELKKTPVRIQELDNRVSKADTISM